MKLASVAAAVVAASLLGTGVAPAQPAGEVHERIFEFSPLVGVFLPDDNIHYSSASGLTGFRATLNNSSRWALEGTLALAPGQSQTTRSGMLQSYNAHPAFNAAGNLIGFVFTDLQTRETETEVSTNLLLAGGSLILHLTDSRMRPFVSIGAGFIDDLGNETGDPPSPFSNAYGDVGFGLKYYRPSGWGVRLEVHDLVMRRSDLPQPNERAPMLAALRDLATGGGTDGVFGTEPYRPDDYRGRRWLNNYAASVSLTIPLGWAWKDGDGDTIEDRFDECRTTAPGVVVDPTGCGLDSDEDGIFDGLDLCEDTPLGATVDLQGCPSDTDGDGILDGIDQCADTPVGAIVSAQGCPSDQDGDGVLDGLDDCNDTPLGAAIDDRGCVKNPVEAQLLRRELIRVANVRFEPNSAELEPLSYHYVNKIGRLLERWTGHDERPLRIEIGVHTDGIGSERDNLDLSQRRAETIRTYLIDNFYRMGANNLVATGYGESLPIADNRTPEGRAANRRVEIRVLGPGDPPERLEPTEIPDELEEDLPELDLPETPLLPEPEMPDIE